MNDQRTAAYIGVGANLGNPLDSVRAAIVRCAHIHDLSKVRSSSLYRSDPIEAQGPPFVNAVVQGWWQGDPLTLLRALQAIEIDHGRQRPYQNAPRTLDLDLLLVGDFSMATTELTLPHPRMMKRAFVLVPLAELEPDLKGPGFERGLAPWLAQVADQQVERIAPSPLAALEPFR